MSRSLAAFPRRERLGDDDRQREAGSWSIARLLPWCLIGLLGMLWLVPFDAVQLPVRLPIDSKLDRFVLGAIVVAWAMVWLGRRRRDARAPSALSAAILVWLAAIGLSTAINLEELVRTDDLGASVRALSLAASFVIIFAFVSAAVRADEVATVLNVSLALACVMALGVVLQFRTDLNVFYRFAEALPGVDVAPPAEANRPGERREVAGPMGHGLAVCTCLGMMCAWALVSFDAAKDGRRRLLHALALVVLLAGAVSTVRKTAIVLPLTAMAVALWYRPRALPRLLPLVLVLVLVLQVLSPGALSGLRYQLTLSTSGQSGSVKGRQADYPAVSPDVASHILVGRGYGSYPAAKYRFLDNSLLGSIIGTGVLGTAALLGLITTAVLTGRRAARARDPQVSGPAVALIAAFAVFGVSTVLFDCFAFRHVPYLFFLLAGLAVALNRTTEPVAGRMS